jgi:hypothetical protein
LSDIWSAITGRLNRLLKPRHILLAGARDAALGNRLADAAIEGGAVLHVARAQPAEWMDQVRSRAGDGCVLHVAPPVDAIAVMPVPELCWVDADPNWFTVSGILQALADQADARGKPFPVTLVTGCGWPHGRRDSYDDPAAIPAAARRPHERTGLLPGQSAPAGAAGLHAERYHAVAENEPGNGVLTAVEDFCLAHGDAVRMMVLPGFGGLAAIWPRAGAGATAFNADGLAADALAMAGALEAARLDQEVRLRDADLALQRANGLTERLQAAVRNTLRQRNAAAPPVAPRGLRTAVRVWRALRRRMPGGQARLAEAASVARLLASPAFDVTWYLLHNDDVAAAGADPALHFLREGAAALRDPNPYFSTAYYTTHYPDVARSGINPLLHYLDCGAAEGRNPGPRFATRRYLEQNPDVAAAGLNPLEHFLASGAAEGRSAPTA